MPRPSEDRAKVLDEIAAQVRACTRCRLHEGRTLAVPGEGPGHARILLVGEAPGREEDACGRPFVGRAGRILDRAIGAADLDRGSVFITNVVKCRPPGNRKPKRDEIQACAPYLDAQLKAIRPRVVVALGETALSRLGTSQERLGDVRGRPIDMGTARVIPTYHPGAIRYGKARAALLNADLRTASRAAASATRRRRS